MLAAIALPFPLPGLRKPEETVPLLGVLFFAAGLGVTAVWRVCPPLGGVLVWAALRTAWAGWPMRSLEGMAFLSAGAILFVGAARLPASADRWAAGGLLTGAGVTAGLGVLNLTGRYPGLWVDPDFVGQPMGLLTHANYWGLFLAFALPVLWASVARRSWSQHAGVLGLGLLLVLTSQARAAMLAAAVAVWGLLSPRQGWGRWSWAGLPLVLLLPWLWHGRLWTPTLWLGAREAAWSPGWVWWVTRAPWTGHGLGMWRQWALWPAGPLAYLGTYAGWWEMAHSEPLQLGFELGGIGLALGAWLAGWLGVRAWRHWRVGTVWDRAWALIVLQAGLALWWTPVLHIPALVVVAVWAAGRVSRDDEKARWSTRSRHAARKDGNR